MFFLLSCFFFCMLSRSPAKSLQLRQVHRGEPRLSSLLNQRACRPGNSKVRDSFLFCLPVSSVSRFLCLSLTKICSGNVRCDADTPVLCVGKPPPLTHDGSQISTLCRKGGRGGRKCCSCSEEKWERAC